MHHDVLVLVCRKPRLVRVSEAKRETLGVAMGASRADLRAARYRIPARFGPLDRAVVCGHVLPSFGSAERFPATLCAAYKRALRGASALRDAPERDDFRARPRLRSRCDRADHFGLVELRAD